MLNAAVEEIFWVVMGVGALGYMIPVVWDARKRWLQLLADGRNGQAKILLRGDLFVGVGLVAVQMLLSFPGVVALFRPSVPGPANLPRLIQITMFMVAQGLILWMAWYRKRMFTEFYGYEGGFSQAQHRETMAAIQQNTDITTTAAAVSVLAAEEAKEAKEEATAAKIESTAAHKKMQTVIDKIDESTRRREEGC